MSEDRAAIVFGVANKRSIAWGITRKLHTEGVKLTLAYQDRFLRGLEKLLEDEGINDAVLVPCDVTEEGSIEQVFAKHHEARGRLDHVVHSIAFAQHDDLSGAFTETSRDGFKMALDISAYSLIPMAKHAKRYMHEGDQPGGGSIIAMTYIASQRVVANYNVMGTAKAALEHIVRQLAYELGPLGIRVNAVSAGPLQTVSARGVGGFSRVMKFYDQMTPMKRNITLEEVAGASGFLLGADASGITGQTLYVDAGFSIMALSDDVDDSE